MPSLSAFANGETSASLNRYIFALIMGHPAQTMVGDRIKERMHDLLRDSPELEKKLTPTWVVGCRRLTPGDGYIEALKQDNVRPEWAPIDRITEKGILRTATEDGPAQEDEFDLIVCATGFDTSFIPNWKQVGRNGTTMTEMWKEDPEALWSVHVIDQPNYFVLNGPNIPISHGSVLAMMGWVCDHILQWTQKINRQNIQYALLCFYFFLFIEFSANKQLRRPETRIGPGLQRLPAGFLAKHDLCRQVQDVVQA